MSIKLKYIGTKPYELKMTETPISNPQASPKPAGIGLAELDPNDVQYKKKSEEILNHPNYSPNKTVILEPNSINDFKNEEQAEYLYKILGNPETGGTVPIGVNEKYEVKNPNIIFEVDKDGNEIKDNLWLKYRRPAGVQFHKVR